MGGPKLYLYGPVADSYKHSSEHSGSTKYREFLADRAVTLSAGLNSIGISSIL
jgi:hypothetical protein